MKFLKRNQLNSRNVKDNRIAVEITDEVKLDTENVLLIPTGPTTSRPGESGTVTSPVEGHIRYNTTDHEFEGRQGSPDAWRKFRFKEPALITQQNFYCRRNRQYVRSNSYRYWRFWNCYWC